MSRREAETEGIDRGHPTWWVEIEGGRVVHPDRGPETGEVEIVHPDRGPEIEDGAAEIRTGVRRSMDQGRDEESRVDQVAVGPSDEPATSASAYMMEVARWRFAEH